MFVDVQFDKPRKLRYDLGAIRELETATGEPLGNIVRDLGRMGMNTLILTLWAGLKHDDRALTPGLVGRRLERFLEDGGSLKTLLAAVNDALDGSGIFKSLTDEEAVGAASPPAVAPAPEG